MMFGRLQQFYAETLLVLSDLLAVDLLEEAEKEQSDRKLERHSLTKPK